MSAALSALLIFVGVGIAVWLFSFVLEALRPVPRAPQKLRWAPDIAIEFVEVGGNTLRYIKTGKGPNLVLLHTLRTQLDLFEKIDTGALQALYRLRAGLSRARLFGYSAGPLRRGLLHCKSSRAFSTDSIFAM